MISIDFDTTRAHTCTVRSNSNLHPLQNQIMIHMCGSADRADRSPAKGYYPIPLVRRAGLGARPGARADESRETCTSDVARDEFMRGERGATVHRRQSYTLSIEP